MTPAKVEALKDAIDKDPRISGRKAAAIMGNVSRATGLRVLRQVLKKKPYKPSRVHKLNDKDKERRREFCMRILARLRSRFALRCHGKTTPLVLENILFFDEKLYRSCTAPRHPQNDRIWVDAGTPNKKSVAGAVRLPGPPRSAGIMACTCLSRSGCWPPFFIQKGAKIDSACFQDSLLRLEFVQFWVCF